MKLAFRTRTAPPPQPPAGGSPDAPPAAACRHAGERTVRRERYRVRSLGWSLEETICADCGAALRRRVLRY